MTPRKKEKIKFTNTLLIVGSILALIFLGYIFYRTYQSERTLLSIMTIPLILGVVFENKRLSSDWKTIFLKILGALLLSLFAFSPGKKEQNYSFENHIEIWPYFFVFFFVLISVAYHDKKVVPKLTEGITLLQSVSIIYWIIDIGFLNVENIMAYILMTIGIIFSAMSLIHAFSYIKLTPGTRLFLSIWSSIIMMVFAIDYMYRVFNSNYFAGYEILNNGLNILQYFLLGVSLMYFLQNALMLLEYFPSRNRFYGKKHMNDIREMNQTHIERYSQNQVKISDSLMALIFSSGLYYWNYTFQILPGHTLIWLVFWIFPFIILIKEKVSGKRRMTANYT